MNTHRWLNQAFAVAEGYLANRILVHCLVPVFKPNDDSKSPNYCALLGTRTTSDDGSKRIGGGMDIPAFPLAVTIITFIVQVVINVTMIATMVRIITIRIRAVQLVRVIVTATVKVTMIMIVILIVLVAVRVLNIVLVKRMKVVIVVLAALILVVIRTTIICSNKLNIDTNHNNSATINTNIRKHGSS